MKRLWQKLVKEKLKKIRLLCSLKQGQHEKLVKIRAAFNVESAFR
jgi:hypothetical protein